jgi:GR25 family glycosyltransferase involved in LPS biosynthesis
MRLSIPKKIKEELQNIAEVFVEYNDTSKNSVDVFSFGVSKLHFEKMDFVNMADSSWQNCSFVRYRLKYLDGREEVLRFESKESAKYGALNDLGVFLDGKEIKVGSFFAPCEASKDIANNNLFSFKSIKDIPAYVINLDSDYSRYLEVVRELTELGFSNLHRWNAVDTREDGGIARLKRYGVESLTEFYSYGAAGCTVSHLNLYEDFLKSEDQFRLVFEDDVTAHSKFHELISSVNNLSLDSFDVLFLGGWFWGFGEKDIIKDVTKALELAGETCLLRNPTSFETHAMLISRRFAFKAVDNYRRWISKGGLTIDTYITQSKYFDKCLLTFSPFDSANVDKLQLRNMNNCGLFFQKNIYGSHLQKKSVQGIKEIKREESGGYWHKVLPQEEYRFDKFNVYGESALLQPITMPEVGVLVLEGGILSSYGVVGTKEERWVSDLSWFGSPIGRGLDVWETMFKQKKKNNCFSAENLIVKKGSALNLCAVWSQFNPGHFQMDSLGMLALAIDGDLKQLDDFDWICLPRIEIRIKKDLLALIDIDPSKLIELLPGEFYQFDELHAPSLYGAPERYRRGAFRHIRNLFKTKPKKSLNKLIYVSREEAGRDVSNLTELEELLHDYGFQKISSKSLRNYVNIFAEALIVVGAHGAGLSNCMFCSPAATLIELLPEFHQKPYYMSLADSVGMDYVGILCTDAGLTVPTTSYAVNKEKRFIVNLNLLEGTINGVLHKKLQKTAYKSWLR